MADIGNISDALALKIASILYPNRSLNSYNSISGRPSVIKRGWIREDDISGDCGISNGLDVVTITPHGGAFIPRSFDMSSPWKDVAIIPATVQVTTNQQTATISIQAGQQASGIVGIQIATNGVSITPNGTVAAYACQAQDSAATIATSLASQIQGASSSGASVTFPDAIHLTSRVGNMGVQRRVFRRQQQVFSVNVWSGSPEGRDATAGALEQAMASEFFIPVKDGTLAQLVFSGARDIDDQQGSSIFRRLLTWQITYCTIQEQTAPQAMWLMAQQHTMTSYGIALNTIGGASPNLGVATDGNGDIYMDAAGNLMLMPSPDYDGLFINSSGIVSKL